MSSLGEEISTQTGQREGHVETQGETASYKPGAEALAGTNAANTLVLFFSKSLALIAYFIFCTEIVEDKVG